jgi:hypothetical protein
MQDEYDITFTRQFGEMDGEKFTPPTSSNYNKVSSLLSTCTNTVSTIPITIFHDVSVQQMARSSEQSSNSGSNTRSASRMDGIISKMTFTNNTMSPFRILYQANSAQQNQKVVKESFWKEVVYPEALKIWRTQTVMNVSNCVNDRAWNEHVRNSLKFQVLDKTNPNDTWGLDNLGNQDEEDM